MGIRVIPQEAWVPLENCGHLTSLTAQHRLWGGRPAVTSTQRTSEIIGIPTGTACSQTLGDPRNTHTLEALLWVGEPKPFVGEMSFGHSSSTGQERQVGLSFRRHYQHLVPEVLPSLQRELWKHHPADRQAVSRYNPCL